MLSKKGESCVGISLPFRKVACDDGAIWYYCTLYHCVETSTKQETMKGMAKYTKKTPPDYGTMSFIDMQTSLLVSWNSLSCGGPHSQNTHLS